MSRSKLLTQFKPEMLSQLNQELDDVYRRIDAIEAIEPIRITYTVGTTETVIRHTLNRVPRFISVVPYTAQTVFRTRNADEKAVYLAASASVIVDVYML